MMLRIFLLFLTLAPLSSPLHAGLWDNITGYFKEQARPEPPTIRVLILHNADKANLQIRGRYSLYDPYTNSHVSTRFAGKSRVIQPAADGLKWGESFPGLYQLKIEPDEPTALINVNGIDYRGVIYVYDIGGSISIVNQIPVESYVRGVMAAYQDQPLESETLSAMAIVARTNAYALAANPKNTYWSVDAQKVGFQGITTGSAATEEAVRQTRYMIMSRTGVYEGGATPFPAVLGDFPPGHSTKDAEISKMTLEDVNNMAKKGEHAAQILGKAFPGTNIMLIQYAR